MKTVSNDSINVLYSDFTEDYLRIIRGEGVFLYDEAGKEYLDAISGVGVANIGHGVEEIVEIIREQSSRLSFCYDVDNEPRRELSKKLQQWSPKGMGETKSLYCSSGSEANESALKLAYQYHFERGDPTKHKIISRWQSYHGNTIGSLSMSGRTQWRKMFNPYLLDFPHIHPPYCYRCPYSRSYPHCEIDCALELERLIQQEGQENIAAFIAEPVIGTSMSAVVPPPEYYKIIRSICEEYNVLLIVDEVMSGIGRTGKNFGIEHWNTTPDIITTAKGLSGGYSPLAVTILGEKIWRVIEEGSKSVVHSYTYGGNPLSCAVGTAVLNYIEKNQLIKRAEKMGEALIDSFNKELGHQSYIGQIRGKGLFIGVEIVADKESKEPFPPEKNLTKKIVEEAKQNGLLVIGGVKGLVNGVKGDHIELIPPYIIDEEHIKFITEILRSSIHRVIDQELR